MSNEKSSWSSFPSLPPPTYLATNLVSLLDCKGLAAREAEHKKWLHDTQASSCATPIGMRAMDLEDDFGIDLEEEEGGNDSVEEEEEDRDELITQGNLDSESAMDDHSEWLANRFDEEDSSPVLHDISLLLGPDFSASDDNSSSPTSDNS